MPKKDSIPRPDPGQDRAIRHGAGPMLVLAGPGSGKTHVITHRIRYLISECRIPPNEILVITFTKAAALEMQARANHLIRQSSYVQFGTFHSVFYQILKRTQTHRKFTLVSDRERTKFIKEVLKSVAGKGENPEMQAERYIKAISQMKNRLPGKENRDIGNDSKTEEIKALEKVLRIYDEWLKETQKLDFDDMLRLCYFYLRDNLKEREKWQKRFSYILIDELQDINPLQYETVKLLSGNRNFFAVGDDDQAIYGFRGADPFMMKRFEQEFGAEVVRLNVNYRCSGKITEAAGRFIGHNRNRFPKEIIPFKGAGEEICIMEFPDEEAELMFLKEHMENYKREHPDKTQAVLARTNGMLESYRKLSGKKKNPLWEDVAAYLAFINCGRKREDFLKIMNKPVRYISRNVLIEPVIDFKRIINRLEQKPWIQKRAGELEKQVNFAERLDLKGQLYYIWKALGYGQYAKECCGSYPEKIKENAAWFADLLGAAEGCRDFSDLQEVMKKRGQERKSGKEVEEQEEKERKEQEEKEGKKQEERKGEQEGSVHMLTYHGAKGLEFDRVYLPDLNYGKVPHGRMLTKEELEEERRMFYVAMTRAKESLVLLYVKNQTRSPFLTEI